MSKVCVSIIIPVFNAENYLSECLNSIISQSLQNIEILCVDDCSTDQSAEIITEYQQRDQRVSLLSMQHNSGSGPTRNMGISHANGQYICFIDPDDLYPNEDVLNSLLKAAQKGEYNMVGGNLLEFCNNNQLDASDWGRATFKEDRVYSVSEYPHSTGYTRFIYKREWLNGNDIKFPDLRRYQDPVWFAKTLVSAGFFYGLNIPSYLRRFDINKVYWDVIKINDAISGMAENIKFFSLHKMYSHLSSEKKTLKGFLASVFKNKNISFLKKVGVISFLIKTIGFCATIQQIYALGIHQLRKLF